MTLARATLAVGVAALVADSFTHDTPVALLVSLSAVALALDAVDGWVARRTGTASALGARFDGEVDAFLIGALSVYVAPAFGAWVLAIGPARYLFGAGEWLLPWMRAPLPPRRWRKVVAATQGVVLTVAAAGVLPRALTQALLVVALALLAESIGECTWWLWRRRDVRPRRSGGAAAQRTAPRRSRSSPCARLGGRRRAERAEPAHRRRLRAAPARAPRRRRPGRAVARHAAPRAGRGRGRAAERARAREGARHRVLHGVRPAVQPRRRLRLRGYRHRDAARRDRLLAREPRRGVAVVLIVALLVLPVLALLRVTRVAAGHRGWALRAAAALGVVWVVLRVLGAPVASTSAAALAVDEVRAVQTGLQDHDVLAREIARDRFGATPGDRLLTGLRGKDVLLVFVESYGRVAVQDSSFSPRIDARARPGHRAAAGGRLLLAQRAS